MKMKVLVITLAAFLAAVISYIPYYAVCQDKEKKSPPPGVPTDKDPRAYLGLFPEQIEKLKNGEVVILKAPQDLMGKKLLVAATIFEQDLNTVWELMTQPWRQEEYLPGLDRSELVEKWEDGSLVDFQVRIMTVKIDYRIRHTNDNSNCYFHWKLDPGYDNEMKEVMGFYRFYWIDENHTLARYGTSWETKFFIPPKIQNFMLKQSLPEALGAVKKWVESGGKYRKKEHHTEK